MNINHDTLKDIIVNVAKQELLPRFANVAHSTKSDKSIVTEADIAAQESIAVQLQQHWPEIPLLGEEMTAEQQTALLKTESALWCLDPLDGTSNFAIGIPYFAISLALIVKNRTVLAIVYDPSREEYFFAYEDEQGKTHTTLNEKPLKLTHSTSELSKSIAIVDLKRLKPELASRIASEQPFASQRNFGASALDWCWLAAGRSHIYLHGNQNIWDYAAGELIFRTSGGYSTTLKNEPVFKQALEKRSVVAAVDKSLFDEWYNWLKH